MANSDTILALNGVGATTAARNQLASITGINLGTETLMTMGTDAGSNVTAFLPIVGQTTIAGRSNPMSINVNPASLLDQFGAKAGERGATAPWFNSSSFDGRGLRFRVQGRYVTSAGSNTLTIKFYVNTVANGPVTAGAGTIATVAIGAAGLAASTNNFIVEATTLWDSVSGRLQCAEFWGAAGGAYVTRAINSSLVTITGNLSGYVFFASATFLTGAANAITPIELAYEDV